MSELKPTTPEERKEWREHQTQPPITYMDKRVLRLIAHIDRLEAENAKLREALARMVKLNCPLTGKPSRDELVKFWQYEKSQGRAEADDQLFALDVLAMAALPQP